MLKRLFVLLTLVLLICSVTVSAAPPLIVDDADLLSASEEATLRESLRATGEKLGINVSADPAGWLICIGIGVIVGLIAVLIMKSQLRSVRPQNAASGYRVSGSFDLTHSNELFLFRNVSRVRRSQDSGHHSGHSHRSSSGRSHGGGGRF